MFVVHLLAGWSYTGFSTPFLFLSSIKELTLDTVLSGEASSTMITSPLIFLFVTHMCVGGGTIPPLSSIRWSSVVFFCVAYSLLRLTSLPRGWCMLKNSMLFSMLSRVLTMRPEVLKLGTITEKESRGPEGLNQVGSLTGCGVGLLAASVVVGGVSLWGSVFWWGWVAVLRACSCFCWCSGGCCGWVCSKWSKSIFKRSSKVISWPMVARLGIQASIISNIHNSAGLGEEAFAPIDDPWWGICCFSTKNKHCQVFLLERFK